MQWRTGSLFNLFPEKKENHIGDKRVTVKFLFFPRSIQGQTRWLETAQIDQEFQRRERFSPGLERYVNVYKWYDISWNDEFLYG